MEQVSHVGGCLCGAVRFTVASDEPLEVSLCHCSSCRRAAGASPVAWVVIPLHAFETVGGSLASYSSSEGVERTFCSVCGTSLTFRETDPGDSIDVTLASFDQPEAFTPTRHIWLEDSVIEVPEGLARYPRSSRESQSWE